MAGCSAAEPDPAGTVGAPREAAASAGPTAYRDGTYRVPEDIRTGLYRTQGPADEAGVCYWERLKGLSGDVNEIIANGQTEGPGYVRIKETDVAFSTEGCQPWTRVEK